MVTLAGTHSEIYAALKQIIELDYDAIKAYEAAISRLENTTYIDTLEEFKNDHQRHVDELSDFLTQNGQTPPSGPDLKSVLTQGKVIIAALATDLAILRAMRSNEKDTLKAYENINAHADKPAELTEILERNLSDEQRHSEWLTHELENDYLATGT